MSTKYNLYSSEGCHLCEQALSLCLSQLNPAQISVVDIVEDETLVEQYGVHIPVLENLTNNKKLYWPFDSEQLESFL